MAKKKSKQEPSSISAVSSAEAYEATYFARKCGLTPDEALKIMREAQGWAGTTTSSGAKRKN
ncbi:3-hydroxyisobutyrate dehydrogenase-like beta-hydroxyacid dehydrogenase [Mesorhizobium robiniae]|uniref:3-hydroxyisobutyrate dehydrogenase-like beta-hydroxyacid dehydrogenase n=1 Tax=Mesorhizobium robiniae TaxID=559315 RepID=A0ABV2GH50_9HYPH